MKISFAICTHNEGEYIQTLLDQLVPFCQETGDEIVIVDDNSTDELTRILLDAYSSDGTVQVFTHDLNKDFANHKNYLSSKCSGDYIFQIDADETINPVLLSNIHEILEDEANAGIDLYIVPRVNVVLGLTTEDADNWNWSVNDMGWNCWPDYQTRIFKNHSDIKWTGSVHERIVGFKTSSTFPAEEIWSLYHIKTIDRQKVQNQFYDTFLYDNP